MTEYNGPLPEPTAISAPFWAAAKDGMLRIQRCPECSRYVFYPRNLCPHCLSSRLEWVTASGRGIVYSWTTARRTEKGASADTATPIVAVVELAEGPRLVTTIVDSSATVVRIGMAVRAVFDAVTPEVTLVRFAPAER